MMVRMISIMTGPDNGATHWSGETKGSVGDGDVPALRKDTYRVSVLRGATEARAGDHPVVWRRISTDPSALIMGSRPERGARLVEERYLKVCAFIRGVA